MEYRQLRVWEHRAMLEVIKDENREARRRQAKMNRRR